MKLTTFFLASNLNALLTVLALPLPDGAAQSNTLLSVLSSQPDLSIFSSLIEKSGGNRPNPALEERFNSPLDTRNYTAFAPTNAAMLQLTPSVLDLLGRPQSYELLESLIRLHIAEGMYTKADLTSTTGETQIISIEGFPLTVSTSGTSPAGEETLKINDVALNLTDIPASNGRIHTVDGMLNPYSRYFGISNSTAAPAGGNSQNEMTMADILASDSRLSVLYEQIMAVDPDFLTRLSLSKPENEEQIYLAPSNEAFQAIDVDSMAAPSNVGLSSYLLTFGLLSGNLGALNMMVEGEVESVSGWNITVRKRGDAWVMGNAVVVARDVCAGNGCVWILDRMLDPIYGVVG